MWGWVCVLFVQNLLSDEMATYRLKWSWWGQGGIRGSELLTCMWLHRKCWECVGSVWQRSRSQNRAMCSVFIGWILVQEVWVAPIIQSWESTPVFMSKEEFLSPCWWKSQLRACGACPFPLSAATWPHPFLLSLHQACANEESTAYSALLINQPCRERREREHTNLWRDHSAALLVIQQSSLNGTDPVPFPDLKRQRETGAA